MANRKVPGDYNITIRNQDDPPAIIGECRHCGGGMLIGLPATAGNVVSVVKVFMDMHRDCKPKPEQTPMF